MWQIPPNTFAKYQHCATLTDRLLWTTSSRNRFIADYLNLVNKGQYLRNIYFEAGEWPRIKYLYGKVHILCLHYHLFREFTEYPIVPTLRIYRMFKHDNAVDLYLYLVKKHKYRQANAKFICGSQTLEHKYGQAIPKFRCS